MNARKAMQNRKFVTLISLAMFPGIGASEAPALLPHARVYSGVVAGDSSSNTNGWG
jgi:hypothetical protein